MTSNIYDVEGIHLDVEASTITIAGKPFPAAVFFDGDEWWGGDLRPKGEGGSWMVYVPTENGLLVSVWVTLPHPYEQGTRIDAILYAPVWETDSGDLCHLLTDGRECFSRKDRAFRPGQVGYWENCEPDWLAEHIVRLSALPVKRPRGNRVHPSKITPLFAGATR